MAKRLDSLESFLSCPVCFEDFEKDGKRVPRILPCSHTLCESCVKQPIQDNKLECPECRKTYEAGNREKSFPQNRYLLFQIKRGGARDPMNKKISDDCERCEEHGKELNLFCRDPGCQKHICVSCSEQHRKHNIVNSEDMKSDLLHEMNILIENLESRIKLGSDMKKDVSMKTKECIANLEKKKEELFDHINNMIAEAEKEEKETIHRVDDAVSTINEKLALLCSMKQNFESVEGTNLRKYQETFRAIAAHSNRDLTGKETFWYPKFIAGRVPVEAAVGTVTRTDINTLNPHASEQKDILSNSNENATKGLKTVKLLDAEKIKCTGKLFGSLYEKNVHVPYPKLVRLTLSMQYEP